MNQEILHHFFLRNLSSLLNEKQKKPGKILQKPEIKPQYCCLFRIRKILEKCLEKFISLENFLRNKIANKSRNRNSNKSYFLRNLISIQRSNENEKISIFFHSHSRQDHRFLILIGGSKTFAQEPNIMKSLIKRDIISISF